MTSVSLSTNVSVGHVRADVDASAKSKSHPHHEEDTAMQIVESDSELQMLHNRAALERRPAGENLGSELDNLLAQPSPLDKYR